MDQSFYFTEINDALVYSLMNSFNISLKIHQYQEILVIYGVY